jgi:pimeloyl-ACP methyl ester carboxylesterase
MAREAMPDVLILVPGILGSVLCKDGRDMWAPSGKAVLAGLLGGGDSLRELVLSGNPVDDDPGDGVTADRLIPDVHLLPGLWKIDGYSKIRDTLERVFAIRKGENYFEFPYDWRLDNRVAARQLQRDSHDWLKAWRQYSGNSGAKLILVAHSMGGLVARYFLELLDGWRNTRALVTFGTPFRGSLNALHTLANGVSKGPFGFLNLSTFVRSLTSVYQLLPIYQSYDPGGGQLVRIGETDGIPNVDARRAIDALAFHREIMDQVDQHRKQSDYMNNGYRTFPIVGIEQPTFQSARRAGDTIELLRTYGGKDQRGDGTVPRVSASPHEMSDDPREMYSATRHASLQNAHAVQTHLTGLILNLYVDLGEYRAPVPTLAKLGLDMDDIYWTDELVTTRVQPDREGLELIATIDRVSSGMTVTRESLKPSDDGWQRVEFGPLSEGVYRITISGQTGVEAVADIFAVVDRHSSIAYSENRW